MADFRVTVVLDYTVPDGTDEDEFHDKLRDQLENNESLNFDAYDLDTVRDIEVEVLDDDED